MRENFPKNGPNPFEYGTFVTGEQFCGRKKEIADLRKAILGHQHLLINAERRIGKTSLVEQTLLQLPEDKYVVCALDLYKTEDEASFANAFGRAVAAEKAGSAEGLLAQAKKFFQRLKPTVKLDTEGKPSLSLEIAGEMQRNPDQLLEEVLDSPVKLAAHTRKHVVVVMDEFQEIFNYPSSRVERHLRTALQRQRDIAYLVLGSRRRLIAKMVLEENRPLYRALTLFNLGLIPPEDWKPFLAERFARKGVQLSDEAFSQVMTVTGGHPYYVQNLCHVVWEAVPAKGLVSLAEVDQARETVLQRESYAFTVVWENLTANQRRFLKALATDPGRKVRYLSADFIQQSGLKAAANVQRAMNSLIEKDLVDRGEGACNIADPWFRLWIAWRT
ncbi:MAG TPA: ATP-binding protein [Candidatus Acidoferrales bacterium]|nr:ATP-binding protein [Candidatus Acidoferrales bacterium]